MKSCYIKHLIKLKTKHSNTTYLLDSHARALTFSAAQRQLYRHINIS